MKVGVIGLGSIARKHIDALRQIDPDVSLCALRHKKDAENVPRITNVFSYEEMHKFNPDFIIISNPTSCHRATIANLAGYDIPLFIEKPLQDNLYPPVEIKARTYVACNLRFLDCLRYIRIALSDQRVNEVNSYCGSYLPDWRQGSDWRECYSANREMGGGVHIDLIHEIDYLYWLFGKPVNVQKTFRNVSSLDISACDYANYIMEYPCFTASVILNYYRKDYKRSLEIITETGTWNIDLVQNSVIYNGRQVYKSSQTITDTYLAQMRYFIGSIGSDKNFNDITEAFEILKICLE